MLAIAGDKGEKRRGPCGGVEKESHGCVWGNRKARNWCRRAVHCKKGVGRIKTHNFKAALGGLSEQKIGLREETLG